MVEVNYLYRNNEVSMTCIGSNWSQLRFAQHLHKKSCTTASSPTSNWSELMSTKHNRHDLLVVSTHGHIYCLHKKTGFRLWRSDFPAGITGGLIALFINDADQLIAASRGKTCAFNLFTGAHQWTNTMEGMGYHEVSVISTPTNNHGVSYNPLENEKSGWDSAPSDRPPEYVSSDVSIVLTCSFGKVMGINSSNGKTLWRFDCPSGGYNLPTVLVEKNIAFIGCGRMVYALNPKNGGVLWETKATNGLVGSGWLTMATVWGSRQAEIHTSNSNCPVPQKKMEDERRNSSSGGS